MQLSEIQIQSYERARAIYESEWIWYCLAYNVYRTQVKKEVVNFLFEDGILYMNQYNYKCPLCELYNFLGYEKNKSTCIGCPWPGSSQFYPTCENPLAPHPFYLIWRYNNLKNNDNALRIYNLIRTFY